MRVHSLRMRHFGEWSGMPGDSNPAPTQTTYFLAVFAGFGASAFTAVATIELPSMR